MSSFGLKLEKPRTDCFSFDKTKRACVQLTSTTCEDCKFYKTWAQFDADAERARSLLRAKGDINLVEKYI